MTDINVAVPVVKAAYQVEVLRRSGLLPLDVALLRTVADKPSTVNSLATALRLPLRLVRAAVVRLIEEDLLEPNMLTDELALSTRAHVAQKEDDLLGLCYLGRSEQRRFSVIQELAWGQILSWPGETLALRLGRRESDSHVVPKGQISRSVLDLREGDITNLFAATQPRRWDDGADELLAIRGRLAPGTGSTFLNLRLTPLKYNGVVELWPVDTSGVWYRPDLCDLLARVRRHCAALPELSRVRAETAASRGQTVSAGTCIVPLTDFAPRNRLESLSTQPLDLSDYRDESEQLYRSCHALLDSATGCRVVINDQNVSVCRELLRTATRFCVVHSALWSEAGVAQYQTEICDALARGVDVFLLRGLDEGDTPGADEAAIIASLRQAAAHTTGHLIVPTRPLASHAKFVVCDGTQTLVSSFNFLGAMANNPQLNVGIRCGPASKTGTAAGTVLLRTLSVQGIPTEVAQGFAAICAAQSFGRPDFLAPAPTSLVLGTAAVDNPPAWFDAEMARGLASGRTPWELMWDEEHREALLRALFTARSSVAIASGDLSESAADRAFLDYVGSAVKRGVRVLILWGHQAGQTSGTMPDTKLLKAIRSRFQQNSRSLINMLPKAVHAKLLVVDDTVSIVTSFNFLSYRGSRAGAHELGIKLYDPAVSRQLREIIETALLGKNE